MSSIGGTLYYDYGNLELTNVGTVGQVLISGGGTMPPSYQNVSAAGAVISVTGGTNVTISGTSTSPVINSASFVGSVGAGTHIAITGTALAPIVNVTGVVTSVAAGTNVTLGGTSTAPVVNVNGVVNSVAAGSNITITGTSTAPIVNTTGVVSSISSGTNISVTGTATVPVVNVTGVVTSVSAGTNIGITGTSTAPIVNFTGSLATPASYCSFLAKKTSNQTISANTTAQITFGTTVYNNGSVFSSNAFTAPATKLYMINVQVYATNASLTDRISLVVNGTAVCISQMAIVLAVLGAINLSVPLALTAGDVVTITYTNSSILTGAVVSGQSTPFNTWFSAYQLT